MPSAVEITTFRLAPGLTLDAFIAANADIDPWLQAHPGFISRHICAREDGVVVDILLWDSVEAGNRAARGVTTEMAASPVHTAIDQSTVTWTIAEARHVVNRH
jgi:hypothetical protein